MDQKKLLKTLEITTSKKFTTPKELLVNITTNLIDDGATKITGGRIWQLDVPKRAYRLIFQSGNVNKIDENFLLLLSENPIFEKISKERTILADETNETLISKGIFRYSASGVGHKTIIDGKKFYNYFIAFNSDHIDDDLRDTLNIVATLLTSKLNENFLSESQKKLIAHLDKAKELQRSILPEHEYKFQGYELFGVTVPAEILGGDFYDYLPMGDDEERLGITVGDAASKGLSAAAEAMYISGALRMATTFQTKISPMMFKLNQLVNKIFSDDKFCTLFYGEISNDKKGLFLYSNAGHTPPIFYSKETAACTYLMPTGPLLGPAPNSKYETHSLNFNVGDVLVMYSDGITEAANDKFEFYEEARLEALIKKKSDLTSREIAYSILDDVVKFVTKESKYQDDKTVVVIKKVK